MANASSLLLPTPELAAEIRLTCGRNSRDLRNKIGFLRKKFTIDIRMSQDSLPSQTFTISSDVTKFSVRGKKAADPDVKTAVSSSRPEIVDLTVDVASLLEAGSSLLATATEVDSCSASGETTGEKSLKKKTYPCVRDSRTKKFLCPERLTSGCDRSYRSVPQLVNHLRFSHSVVAHFSSSGAETAVKQGNGWLTQMRTSGAVRGVHDLERLSWKMSRKIKRVNKQS